jgi:hypothetical protein
MSEQGCQLHFWMAPAAAAAAAPVAAWVWRLCATARQAQTQQLLLVAWQLGSAVAMQQRPLYQLV